MYESPMTRFIYDVQNELNKQEEDYIMATIKQTVGYSVDKEELIKALNYDRHQYEKGYDDGKLEVLDKIRAEIEQLPITDTAVRLVIEVIDKHKAEREN